VNSTDKTFTANPAVLGAFVQAVATAGDSPTVIRRVAENAAYVYLCREIVQLDRPGVPPLLQEACRAADIAPHRLMARLAPVAQALRLVPEDRDETYYKLLGVPPESDATLIRQAYRRRARDLHPDLQPEQAADPQAFTELTTAYQTLRDPVPKTPTTPGTTATAPGSNPSRRLNRSTPAGVPGSRPSSWWWSCWWPQPWCSTSSTVSRRAKARIAPRKSKSPGRSCRRQPQPSLPGRRALSNRYPRHPLKYRRRWRPRPYPPTFPRRSPPSRYP
jgi:hypothetical protein